MRLTMLNDPSPSMKPDAMITRGVLGFPNCEIQYQWTRPPRERARVNDGTLYMPTATAIPPGMRVLHGFPLVIILATVVSVKIKAAPEAHSFDMGGRPFPVTSRAVKIQTYAVGTWNKSLGIW
jgi:hypothetical protein